MARKVQPPETTPQGAKPPQEATGTDGKQERPTRAPRAQLPTRADIDALIAELNAELTGDDREAAHEAARKLRLLSPHAADRLGLLIYGIQPSSPPQVNAASIFALKVALESIGLMNKHDAGVTAEAIEAAE